MCDYDEKDQSISEQIAWKVGATVQLLVEELLSDKVKALEAKMQELKQRVIVYQNELYKMERANRQLEHDSGKPYVEQNEEIERLNSHVANLEAAKVENEELRAVVHEYSKEALCLGLERQEQHANLTAVYNDSQETVEELRAENGRLWKEVEGARVGAWVGKDAEERIAALEDDLFWETKWRKEAREGMKEVLAEKQQLQRQYDGLVQDSDQSDQERCAEIAKLKKQRDDLWGVINEKQLKIRQLQIRLSNCEHWSGTTVLYSANHALGLIHKEARDADN